MQVMVVRHRDLTGVPNPLTGTYMMYEHDVIAESTWLVQGQVVFTADQPMMPPSPLPKVQSILCEMENKNTEF